MPEMQNKIEGQRLRFRDKSARVGNHPDFEKLACVYTASSGLYRLTISKLSRRRQTVLVIFCRSGSVA